MLTFEEWRHTYADVFETDDAARAAWTAASNKGYRAGAQDTRALLTAHSSGAREPIAWQSINAPQFVTSDPKQASQWICSGYELRPLYTHPQPMPQKDASRHLSNLLARIHRDGGQYEAEHGIDKAVADADDKVARLNAMTDVARDAEDARRYRFIKSKMQVGAVQTQLPLYRTLHWIGYEDCGDVRNADAAIDAEIERLDRAKGE